MHQLSTEVLTSIGFNMKICWRLKCLFVLLVGLITVNCQSTAPVSAPKESRQRVTRTASDDVGKVTVAWVRDAYFSLQDASVKKVRCEVVTPLFQQVVENFKAQMSKEEVDMVSLKPWVAQYWTFELGEACRISSAKLTKIKNAKLQEELGIAQKAGEVALQAACFVLQKTFYANPLSGIPADQEVTRKEGKFIIEERAQGSPVVVHVSSDFVHMTSGNNQDNKIDIVFQPQVYGMVPQEISSVSGGQALAISLGYQFVDGVYVPHNMAVHFLQRNSKSGALGFKFQNCQVDSL